VGSSRHGLQAVRRERTCFIAPGRVATVLPRAARHALIVLRADPLLLVPIMPACRVHELPAV
jgi:hypothetical protein